MLRYAGLLPAEPVTVAAALPASQPHSHCPAKRAGVPVP